MGVWYKLQGHLLLKLCPKDFKISLAANWIKLQTLSLRFNRHQKESFSALLALCMGNLPVTGEFPWRRQVTRSFDVFIDLRMNKGLSKQLWCRWFETPSPSLWRHCNAVYTFSISYFAYALWSLYTWFYMDLANAHVTYNHGDYYIWLFVTMLRDQQINLIQLAPNPIFRS